MQYKAYLNHCIRGSKSLKGTYMCNSTSELIQVIEESQAEYPSVLIHKDKWAKIIAEIKELKARPRFDFGEHVAKATTIKEPKLGNRFCIEINGWNDSNEL